MGVDRQFVRRHAVFGKSRRSRRKENSILYWGGRKSEKLVRCYDKKELATYRVEPELHSPLLRDEHISTLEDFDGLPEVIFPHHFRFVDVDWDRLKRNLTRKRNSQALISGAQQRRTSLSRLRRYLRRTASRIFIAFSCLLRLTKRSDRAFTRWIRQFEDA